MDTNVLSQSVLLLNKSFAPMGVISVKRAMILLYLDHADVVAHDGTCTLHNFNTWRELSTLKPYFTEHDDFVHT